MYIQLSHILYINICKFLKKFRVIYIDYPLRSSIFWQLISL